MEGGNELIHLDGVYYRFFLNDGTSSNDGTPLKDGSSVTDILIESYNTNRTYKHSFFVPSTFYGLIIGSKHATRNRIEAETNTFLKFPFGGQEGDIVIIGSNGRDIVSARHRVDMIIKLSHEKDPFTHFISIPMNHESLIINYNEFKTNVLKSSGKNSRGVNEDIFQTDNKLHLTIQMLRLHDAEDEKQAAENLRVCGKEIIEPFLEKTGPITIEAMGVNCMDDDPTNVNVLYAKITDENGHLQELAEKIVAYFIEKYQMQGKCKSKVKLHMTIMNTIFAVEKDESQTRNLRNKRVPFDASNIIEAHKEEYFGKITLSTLHLSKLGEKDENGYYKMITKIDF